MIDLFCYISAKHILSEHKRDVGCVCGGGGVGGGVGGGWRYRH